MDLYYVLMLCRWPCWVLLVASGSHWVCCSRCELIINCRIQPAANIICCKMLGGV